MNTLTVPPSVKTNSINSIICAPDGTLIYTTKTAIVISRPNEVETDPKDFQMIYNAHKKKPINGIAIDPKNWGNSNKYVVSCGDDNHVYLWNAENLSLTSGHKAHAKSTNDSDHCIDIAFFDNFIVSVTTYGQIITWCLLSKTIKQINLKSKVQKNISTIAICPHNKNVCAVGTQHSMVFIVNLKTNGEIIHSLAVGSSHISSISFSPALHNTIPKLKTDKEANINDVTKDKMNEQTSIQLAAATTSGLLSVWHIGNEASLQTTLNLKPKSYYNKKYKTSNANQWPLVVKWIFSDKILVASGDELLLWDIEKDSSKRSCQLIHAHYKTIFGIGAPYFDESDESLVAKRFREKPYVWTAGHDRYLCCVSLISKNILYKYSTFGGAIFDISILPIDPSRIMFASGDLKLKSLNLSQPHTTSITINTVKDENAKVLAILWHPEKENVLVFSTDYRLGVINPDNPKNCIYLKQRFKKPVYSMTWGPLISTENNSTHRKLYICGNGECGFIDIRKLEEDITPIKFDKMTHILAISWNADYSLCAFGTLTGMIIFMKPDHTVLKTIYNQKSKIYSLQWHPKITDPNNSESPNWLASASIDGSIVIYNCKFENDEFIVDQYTKIEAHTAIICSLAWSSHENGKLASCSYDKTIKVWDVFNQNLIAVYYCYDEALSVVWSPFDPDLILCGSRDSMFRIWSVKENHPNKPQTETKEARESVTLLSLSTKESNKSNKHTAEECKETVSESLKGHKTVLTSLARYQNNKKSILDAINRYLHSDGDSCEDVLIYDSFFGSDNDMIKYLDYEMEKHVEQQRWNLAFNIFLWQGKVKEIIDIACAAKQLTPQLVSYAPMVSNTFWRKTCIDYAEQIKEENALVACSYYIIVNKIPEAIQVLCNGKMFREALALLQVRLPDNESGRKDILRKWAEHTSKEGAYEIAAQCYVYLQEFNNAALLLARRKEIDSLKLALALAQRANNDDLSEALEKMIKDNEAVELDKNNEIADIPLQSRLEMNDVKNCILEIDNDLIKQEQDNDEGDVSLK